MLGEMAVEAIDRQVELAVRVPADAEIGFVERPVAGLASGTCSRSAASPDRARSGRDRSRRGRLSSASSAGPMRASKPIRDGMHRLGHAMPLLAARSRTRRACTRCGRSTILPPTDEHPGVGCGLERGDDLSACVHFVVRRSEGGVDDRHLRRVDGELAGEAFAARGLRFGLQARLRPGSRRTRRRPAGRPRPPRRQGTGSGRAGR